MSGGFMFNKNKDFYEFGDFRIDVQARMLYHADAPVALKPKVVETLVALVENAGQIVGKTDLMNAVWQDAFVEENNLSVNIYALRKAFARFDGEQVYIQTVPRRGFRFAVPVKKKIESNGIENSTPIENVSETTNGNLSGDENKLNGNLNGAEINLNGNLPNNGHSKIVASIALPSETTRQNLNKRVRHPFARQNLAAVVLLILCVAVGGSLYALHFQTRQNAESKMNGAARGTENIEAFQFYLRGRELWQTRNNAKMEEGIKFFRRAIELDPNFAAPYLGIADSLSMMRNDAEDWRIAEEYALKALKLAPDSADAHATLGFIAAMNKWQWRESEAYFQKALALDEQSGKAHQWYATLLLIERRFAEAEAHLKRAVEIEPLSPNYNADLCELYLFTARDEVTLTQCRRTNEINPDFQYVFFEKTISIRRKRFDEAAEAWVKASIRFGISEESARRSDWYRAYLKDGFRGWMLADIASHKQSADALLGVWNTAVAYAQLGEREKTLEHLEKACDGRTFLLPFANAQPEFDFVRDDARFQDLMRRVGLK